MSGIHHLKDKKICSLLHHRGTHLTFFSIKLLIIHFHGIKVTESQKFDNCILGLKKSWNKEKIMCFGHGKVMAGG